LVCPESAIVPVAAYGRYAGPATESKGNPYEAHLSVARSDSEPDTFEVIANEWVTAYIASQP
jgi:hypothetical protein